MNLNDVQMAVFDFWEITGEPFLYTMQMALYSTLVRQLCAQITERGPFA